MKTAKSISLMLCVFFVLSYGLAGAQEVNYSGNWVLDKSKSDIQGRRSESLVGITLVIAQKGNDFKADYQYKYDERDRTDTIVLTIGGEQVEREGMGGRGTIKSSARWSDDKTNLLLLSDIKFSGNSGTFEMKSTDTYALSGGGKTLTVKSETESSRGSRTSTYVYSLK